VIEYILWGYELSTIERSSVEEIYTSYEDMPDEDVAELARGNDGDALDYLLGKYKNFVRAKARSYFLIGADREDIVQEGMIGLYKSIRDFRASRLTSFRAFAELCITRQIITAIKTATRQKHRPLNSYVSLNKPVYDEESDRMLIDIISSSKISNPEDIIIGQEDFSTIEMKMGKMLSPLEMQVLRKYIDGKSYFEISNELGRSIKSVDNALQRVKNKLEKLIETNE
jgi:RNA polymerase sporulation-specific sigma factor